LTPRKAGRFRSSQEPPAKRPRPDGAPSLQDRSDPALWHGVLGVSRGAPGYVDDFVAIGEIRGHEAVRAFFRELFGAFPDFTMTVDRVVADDTSAVVQWHAVGTFTGGPFQGIAPTGRWVDVRGVDVMEITDGLIQHNTVYYDGATFARQIGLLPGLGSRADQALLAAFNAKTTLSQWARDRRRRRPSRAR
jgi:steroid delta-isomerase-like uncharacterized protein